MAPGAADVPAACARGAAAALPSGDPNTAEEDGGSGEVTTIFIGGFPSDFRLRELDNMLAFLPGYEYASLKQDAKVRGRRALPVCVLGCVLLCRRGRCERGRCGRGAH